MDHSWNIIRTDLPEELRFKFNICCESCKCQSEFFIKISEIKRHWSYLGNLNSVMSNLLNKKIEKLPKTCEEYNMIEVLR